MAVPIIASHGFNVCLYIYTFNDTTSLIKLCLQCMHAQVHM